MTAPSTARAYADKYLTCICQEVGVPHDCLGYKALVTLLDAAVAAERERCVEVIEREGVSIASAYQRPDTDIVLDTMLSLAAALRAPEAGG